LLTAWVIGAAGYAGGELVRLLLSHPETSIAGLMEARFIGQPFYEIYPHLRDLVLLPLSEYDPDKLTNADIIFAALPHGKSLEVVRDFVANDLRVVDLSADFRFSDRSAYEKWYGTHTASHLLKQAIYGLPELNRDKISRAKLVANPGCYPTGALLALIPPLKASVVELTSIIVNAVSGISGAGRSVNESLMFCEVNEGVRPYAICSHRHMPEIEMIASSVAGRDVQVSFVPHIAPMNRGILSTVYFDLTQEMEEDEVRQIYLDHYRDEPFIRVLPPGVHPSTKNVLGTNYCDLSITGDRGRRAVVVTAIDNLGKGAAGQAVQNMNLMFDLREDLGLDLPPVFP